MFTTKIGKVDVPVRDAHKPSLVWFDAGEHGKSFGERGMFAFWAAVLKNGKKTWGRALVVLPIGDRMSRIERERRTAKTKEDRDIYARIWKSLGGGKNVRYVRPCTSAEIGKWMKSHQTDARHARYAIVKGKYVARPL